MTEIIRAYICNKKFEAIENSENDGLDDSEIPIKARIVPIGCNIGHMTVNADFMREESIQTALDLFRCVDDPSLKWSRRVTQDDNGDFIGREDLITITVPHFSYPCKRIFTSVHNIRKTTSNMLFIAEPTTDGGVIEAGAGKQEAYRGSANVEIRNTQTQFVPGDLLQLKWGAEINDQTYQSNVAGRYFSTPAVTGGVVVGSIGTGITKQFFVKVQGHVLRCVPTDFAEYVLDDWIYLIKQADSTAGNVDRTKSYTDSGAEIGGTDTNLRPLPATVNSIGNESTSFEKHDYDMLSVGEFERFFEMSKHIAVVNSVDYSADTADIAFTEDDGLSGEYNGVSVYYLCEDTAVFKDGAKGFAEGDEVLVLNEYGTSDPRAADLKIVGHKEGIKYCTDTFLLMISTPSGNEAFVWDLESDSIFVEKDTRNNVISALWNKGRSLGPELKPSEQQTKYVSIDDTEYPDNREAEWTELPAIYSSPLFYCHPDIFFSDPYDYDDLEIVPPPKFKLMSSFVEEGVYDSQDILYHIDEVGYTSAIISDPDHSGEVKELYGTEQATSQESGNQIILTIHHLFDPPVPDSWTRPQFTVSGEYKSDLQLFTQEYVNQVFSDYTYGMGQYFGETSNGAGDAIYEHITLCDQFDSEEKACSGEFVHTLRLFTRYRQPLHGSFEQKVMELINFERENRSIAPIKWNPHLYTATEVHASDMSSNTFVGHQGTDDSWPKDRIENTNYLLHNTIGFVTDVSGETITTVTGLYGENCAGVENVYYDTVTEAVNAAISGEAIFEQGTTSETRIDTTVYENVLSQQEYSQLGPAERIVGLWMASNEGHRDILLYDGSYNLWDGTHAQAPQSADLSSDQYSLAEKLDFGMSLSLADDGYYYSALNVGYRPHFLQGFAAVPTENIVQYIDAHFVFSNEESKYEKLKFELA